jgi:hypothetical protein
MVAIACPWCEGDAPLDLELLEEAGGRFTCPLCLTSVELVEDAQDRQLLAA